MDSSLQIKHICTQTQIKTINTWINNFKKGHIKPLYISGQGGCGKTSLANLILLKYNYNIINLSSIYINTTNIIETINNVLINKSICMMFEENISCKGLIVDDLDNYIDNDKCIYKAICNILKNIEHYYNNPIIIISNKISKKISQLLQKKCVVIKLKYTQNKINEIIQNKLTETTIKLTEQQINKLRISNKNNLTSVFEQLKYIQHSYTNKTNKTNKTKTNKTNKTNKTKTNKITSLDNENMTTINYNNSIDNSLIEYVKTLFTIKYDKYTIIDIIRESTYDINSLILLILENSLKYVHNCSNKYSKVAINTICKIYDNITLSDNYEYFKRVNNESNITFDNYIILHGIIIPIYAIYTNNNNKTQFNYTDTSIYSKSIIEIYNNKTKIYIEYISSRFKDINNFIKIYLYAKTTDNIELIRWCELLINNDKVINKDIMKYIKYIISKVYGYTIK